MEVVVIKSNLKCNIKYFLFLLSSGLLEMKSGQISLFAKNISFIFSKSHVPEHLLHYLCFLYVTICKPSCVLMCAVLDSTA